MSSTQEIERQTQEIRQILGMGPNEIFVKTVITPDMAQKLLAFNIKNRTLSQKKINEYAYNMKNNLFQQQSSPIGFFNGELTNGQHRLYACIKAETPFETKIDMDYENNLYTDRLFSRSSLDNMLIAGVFEEGNISSGNERIISSVVKCYLSRGNKSVDPTVQKEFILKYACELNELCNMGILNITGKDKPLYQSSVSAAFLAAYLNGVSKERLMHIRTILNTGRVGEDCTDKCDIMNKKYRDSLLTKYGRASLNTSDRTALYNGITYLIYKYENPKYDKRCTVDDSKPLYKIHY